MTEIFAKPTLTSEQKRRIKPLYERKNYRGVIAIAVDFLWIAAACLLPTIIHSVLYIFSIAIIGARQRALASLLHEAAHGTLFRARCLNNSIGRVVCGWTILQSFGAYRISHVLNHHPKIGNHKSDPDLKYMLEAGVYASQTRSEFVWKFVLSPMLGRMTPKYVTFLLKDRLLAGLGNREERLEAIAIIFFNFAIAAAAYAGGWLLTLILFWWVPFVTIFPLVGWFSELSEHYPMMKHHDGRVFYSRNRYSGFIEKLFVGMHADHLHLTHHLLPGIPHWNLSAATEILREDENFKKWDDFWGGIFSSAPQSERVSLLKYIVDYGDFEDPVASMMHRNVFGN
jgi:fatty acid desaturase